jgi:hypothetical protein
MFSCVQGGSRNLREVCVWSEVPQLLSCPTGMYISRLPTLVSICLPVLPALYLSVKKKTVGQKPNLASIRHRHPKALSEIAFTLLPA